MKINKKVCLIVGIVIVALSIASILLFNFIKNMQEDRRETLQIMEQIKEKYDTFSPMVEEFTTKRAAFYEMKENSMYLESIKMNNSEIQNFMSQYEALVLKVHNENTYLEENCKRKYFDNRVNNTCDLFNQGYEAVMNYYITDVEVYNEIIEAYNTWLLENGEEGTLNKITFTLHKSYIDYDGDGSYLGGK